MTKKTSKTLPSMQYRFPDGSTHAMSIAEVEARLASIDHELAKLDGEPECQSAKVRLEERARLIVMALHQKEQAARRNAGRGFATRAKVIAEEKKLRAKGVTGSFAKHIANRLDLSISAVQKYLAAHHQQAPVRKRRTK